MMFRRNKNKHPLSSLGHEYLPLVIEKAGWMQNDHQDINKRLYTSHIVNYRLRIADGMILFERGYLVYYKDKDFSYWQDQELKKRRGQQNKIMRHQPGVEWRMWEDFINELRTVWGFTKDDRLNRVENW